MPSADPFPFHHRFFFSVIEPAMTIPAAIWAGTSPSSFHSSLVPSHLLGISALSPVPPAINTKMVTRQLGSCYGLAALVAMCVLGALKRVLHRQERYDDLREILKAYFLALAIADLTHIGYTVMDLGAENLLDPKSYNPLVFGNTWIVVLLFVWRCWWYFECGRTPSSPGSARSQPREQVSAGSDAWAGVGEGEGMVTRSRAKKEQ